jgi:hypothetical protein
MNEALVNGPHAFVPSYDIGGVLAWEISKFSAKGVVMNVGENDEGNSYHFYGAQSGNRITYNYIPYTRSQSINLKMVVFPIYTKLQLSLF